MSSSLPSSGTYSIIGSSGEIERYPDEYAQVSQEQIELATGLEQFIIQEQASIEQSFLRIGAALVQFEDQELWRAKGMPSFRAWLSGPEFMFSYEHGTRLMRVVRDLIPAIGEQEHVPPVSKLIAMLPLVADGRPPEEIRDVFEDIQDLTVRDAKERIREARGLERPTQPTTFRATVRTVGQVNLVDLTRYGDDGDIYNMGTINVKQKDWARWEDRFGSFIQYE